MNFLACLESKRDGHALSSSELQTAMAEYVAGNIPDYQMAAFLMAIHFQGLNATETNVLTLAMRDSGEVLTWPNDGRPVVDKHSTGGVGDKVSLPLAPLLACLGFRVPMISGRGLGITGGTLDKLESIPGFTTALTPHRIVEQVQAIGVAMAGQSETIVPADRKLYALRDVTGTVPSIPLITASILSKKLAEGLEALILDVKFGNAAFMGDRDQARQLARSMVTLGRSCGLNVRAMLSDMNTPLGHAAGNWLEILESVDCLRHAGPADLRKSVVECAAQLLTQTRRELDLTTARERATAMLDSGAAYQKWKELVAAQGGDVSSWERAGEDRPRAQIIAELKADRDGWVTRCEAKIVGEVVRGLGGGRTTQDAKILHDVGVDALRKPGDKIGCGDILCRVHAIDRDGSQRGLERLRQAFAIEDTAPTLTADEMEIVDTV